MGKIREPLLAKFICGIIYNPKLGRGTILQQLGKLGELDDMSEEIPFNFTNYYTNEMGADLNRFWVSFKNLISQGELREFKLKTNSLEEEMSVNGNRRANLDPGYILPTKLVLASTKDAPHRIYIGDGIYAEVTLIYKGGEFVPLEWTYPDYRLDSTRSFFESVRKKYLRELKDER